MPLQSALLTATQPSGFGSPPYVIDGTASSCLHLGSPAPATIEVFNLDSNFHNIFFQEQSVLCEFLRARGNITIGPSGSTTLHFETAAAGFESVAINAQDISGTSHIRVEWNAAAVEPCAYGTRLKAAVPPSLVVGFDVLVGITNPFAAAWLIPVLNVLIGTVLDTAALCSGPPPPLPPITTSTPSQSFSTWWAILQALAWPYACECVPGAPPPTPYTPPSVSEPPVWPTFPTFPCDPASLCGALSRILLQLDTLQRAQSIDSQLLELVQRYGVPFAYVRGTRFSTLTATGSQTIGRCIGLLIEVTSNTADHNVLLGAPEYIFDLGWISVMTADGMLDEVRLTRSATTWLSKLIPLAVQVGWALRAGVTIEISELRAEP